MSVLTKLIEFKQKYPGTVMWRTAKHAKIIEQNLHVGEEIKYIFAGQKNYNHWDIFNTFVVLLTNERLIIAHKRLIIGLTFNSVTPDMFNDIKITAGLFWGTVAIDTVKEVVVLTNISKKALPEIQRTISKAMIAGKKEYNND